MNWIATQTKWIMLLIGVITCTTIYAAIDPQAALRSMFGATLEGPLAEILARNWGVLITLVGAMLIYGAYNPSSRKLILTIAALSKLTFVSLVLIYGKQYLGQAGVAIAFDSFAVLLFAICLIGDRQSRSAV